MRSYKNLNGRITPERACWTFRNFYNNYQFYGESKMRLIQNGFANNFGLVGKSLRRYLATTALTATSVAALASPAFADNWTDHVADEGSITIDTSIPNTTNITQHTDFTKVHGDGDINAGWTVNVAQPSNSSKYVLYDVENDPAMIMGTLNANGLIYIFDKNGVIFGQGSQVNVGGIVASTKYLDDQTIQTQGVGEFKPFADNVPEGSVQMKGTINVADAGLAAFVAPNVSNSGVINAKMGKVVLASGEKVTLDLYGDNLVEIAVEGNLENALVENSGAINAQGGTVVLAASAAKSAVENVINMDGVIDVSSVSTKGGKIILSGGNKGVVTVAGELNASGQNGGGDVTVTGQNVDLRSESKIAADAFESGNGGNVLVYGRDYAIFSGRVSGRGGVNGGNGGSAEISAGEAVGYYGMTDLSAANGTAGTLLIDPKNLTISNNSTSGVLADFLSGGTADVNVNAQALADTLAVTHVNLWASETLSTDAAGIDLSTWSAFFGFVKGITTNNLNLAAPTVNINGNIILGTGKLTVNDHPAGLSPLGLGLIPAPTDIIVNTLNLNGLIKTRTVVNGSTSTLAGDAQIDTTANTINVKSPNAKIQQAISFAGGSGETINVAKGTYNESVNVYKTVTLKGAKSGVNGSSAARGTDETIIAPNSPGFNVTANDVTVDGFTITGADNGVQVIDATGVKILNNVIQDSTMNGIYLDGAHNAIVRSNKITGSDLNGIYALDSNTIWIGGLTLNLGNFVLDSGKHGIKVDGGDTDLVYSNKVDDADENGIYAVNTDGFRAIGNIVRNITNGAAFSVKDSEDAEVTSNWLHDSEYGVRFNNVTGDRNDIYGNRIQDIEKDGVRVYDSANVIIDNNDIWNVDNGIWAKDVSGLVITDNDIDGRDGSGKGSFGIYVEDSYDAQIGGYDDGNNVEDFKTGIRVIESASADIEHNNVDEFVDYGVWVSNSNYVDVKRNDVWDGKGTGIRVYSSNDAEINDNDIWDVDGHGIELVDSHEVDIFGNEIDDVGKHGIFVDPSNYVDIAHNDIDGTGWDGINLYKGHHGDIWDNKVRNVKGDGIDVEDNDYVEIWDNKIYNTQENGIEVSKSYDADIRWNKIDEVDHDGINVSDSDYADIYHNQININVGGANTQGDGIEVSDSYGVDIYKNKIDDSGDAGIDLYNTDSVDVYENIITDAEYGIRLNDSGIRGANIDNNDITNVDYGIWAKDVSNLVITDNDVDGRSGSGKGKYGIYVEDSYDAQIGGYHDGNDVEDFKTGIRVIDSASADVEHNDVSEFVDYGIWASDSNYIDIKKNDVSDGSGTGIRVYSSNDAEINENDIWDVDGHGIELVDSHNVDILGNEITNADKHGIFVDPSNYVDVAHNTIHYVGWDGIHVLNGNYVDIWDNHVGYTGGDGIDVVNNDYAEIWNNYIHDAGDNGIEVSDSYKVAIIDNEITDSDGDGIEVTDSNYADIRWNDIFNSGDDGIDVHSSNYVDIVGNDIDGTDYNGIEVTHSNYVDIYKNHITDAGLDGINVYGGIYADIAHNHIYGQDGLFGVGAYGAKRDGIHVENNYGVDITHNKITGGDGVFLGVGGAGAGRDGIHVRNSDWADIRGNEVTAGSPGFLALGGAGAKDDGIDVRNSKYVDIVKNFISGVLGDGIQVRNSKYVDVIANHVRYTGDDGIDVENSAFADIKYNRVRNVANNGIEVENSYDADVIGNRVKLTGDDGIFVRNSDRADIRNNRVKLTGDDGIQVRDSKFLDIDGNRVRFAGDDGIDVENTFWSSITNNNVRFSDHNGIELEDSAFVLIDGNISNDNDDAGIFVDPSYFITVSNNTVKDNKFGIHFDAVHKGFVLGNTITDNFIGFFASGGKNGYIEVSDNTFTDNWIGAKFQSGLIDLTGPGNRFYNGKIAMYFEAWGGNTLKLKLVDDDGIPGYQTWPTTSTPTNFGGTIGEQYFEGQDVAFVYLGRNTFIDPKTREAIWLDGSNSTYYFPAEGGAFTPSIDGLTVDRLAFLEDMFHHRPDASRRGIFWFGELPDDSLFSVAQEDLFNKFDPFNGDLTGLNVRITGLPNIPGAPGAAPGAAFNNIQTFAGGARTTTTASSTDPSALNAIETAAGGPATGGTTQTAAQAAASVEPAAGGDNANCWSDAASIAGGGQSVNVVYGGTFADNLTQAAACGTSF